MSHFRHSFSNWWHPLLFWPSTLPSWFRWQDRRYTLFMAWIIRKNIESRRIYATSICSNKWLLQIVWWHTWAWLTFFFHNAAIAWLQGKSYRFQMRHEQVLFLRSTTAWTPWSVTSNSCSLIRSTCVSENYYRLSKISYRCQKNT